MSNEPTRSPEAKPCIESPPEVANEKVLTEEIHGKQGDLLLALGQGPGKDKPEPANLGTGKEKV